MKKLLAAVLAASMCLSYATFAGAANGDGASSRASDSNVSTERELIDAINGEATNIIVDSGIKLSETVLIERELTINGNGKTIDASSITTGVPTSGGDKLHAIVVRGQFDVEISNLTIDQPKAFGIVASSSNGLVDGDSPTLTLSGVAIKGSKSGGMMIRDDADVTVTDLQLTDNAWGGIDVADAATLNVTNKIDFSGPNGTYMIYADKAVNGFPKVTVGGAGINAESKTSDDGKKMYWENKAEPTEFTVTFDGNGGTPASTDVTTVNGIVTPPADPTLEGFKFEGWFTAETGGEKVDFSKAITGIVTYYAQWTKTDEPVDPVPETFEITFNQPDHGTLTATVDGKTVESPAKVEAGKTMTFTVVPEEGYKVASWNGVNSQAPFTTATIVVEKDREVIVTLVKIDKPVDPKPDPDPDKPSTGGGGGGGGGGGSTGGGGMLTGGSTGTNSGSSTVSAGTATKEATKAVENAVKAAAGAGAKSANAAVGFKNVASMTPDAFKAVNAAAAKASQGVAVKATVQMDTVKNGKVEARMYIDPTLAAGLKTAIKTTVDVSPKSKENAKTASVVSKYFGNEVAVVSFAQQGAFGMNVSAAVKVDTTALNTKTLMFYSYDAKANKFTAIEAPAYFVDSAGYLHFTTPVGGSIVIADKPLARK